MNEKMDANVRESGAQGRESDANLREQWIPAAEAARRLGLSVRTVQKQAQSQKLKSRRDGRVLLIAVPVREQDANQTPIDANVRESDANLVEHLRSEVEFLRAQLEQRDVAESEFRRLLMADRQEIARLNQQLALGAVPEPGEEVSTRTDNQPQEPAERAEKRSWWQFWKRREGE